MPILNRSRWYKMNILIRTDASVSIGSGHVMRCLTIASELQKKGHEVMFYMKQLPGHLIELVELRGFQVIDAFQMVDVCIVDHYEIDEQWEKSIRPFVKKIVVIDDLANRVHDCDVLLDQNVVPNYETRYDLLVSKHCLKLLGPKYLIMRDEFIEQRKQIRNRTGVVRRLLVFMGGTDPTGETMKVLRALEHCAFEWIDVVVGNGNPKRQQIQTICKEQGFHYHCQIDYIASLMAQADFSIGAGGSTTWERCYVGLPSSSTIVAENQLVATKTASSLSAVLNIGWHEQVTVETYKKLLLSLSDRGNELLQMSKNGLKLTDNPDGANPWLERILEVTI